MTQLLVYEKRPRNAAVFARLSGLDLSEVRSLTQLEQALQNSRPRVLAIEVVQSELVSILPLIHHAKETHRAAIVAMPETAVKGLESVLYESGVDLVFRSMLERERVSGLVRRQRIAVSDSTDDAGSLAEKVRSRLPWKRWASAVAAERKNGNNSASSAINLPTNSETKNE